MRTIYYFCCLLYATWTEGADIYVEGSEGEKVLFECSHRLAWNNNKYLCKDLCKGNEDILVTVESRGRAESGRITLVDWGDGRFTVTFSQLQLSDSGRYWCAVDRPGFDTFTAVHLTVKEAVANEITTVIPELSPTWTHENISKSTQLTTGLDTSRPANPSVASNCTHGGEQNNSTGPVLYATGGAVAMLTLLVSLMCLRKRRENSKPQQQVCFNSTDLVSPNEREVECDYDEIEEVQTIKKLPGRVSCTHHAKQDPPTSVTTAAECSVPLHIYENISCSHATADTKYSAANSQDEHDTSSTIYIEPLPSTMSERTGEGPLGKPQSCTSNASACHSTSCSDSMEVKPRSLWFGLDLSGLG